MKCFNKCQNKTRYRMPCHSANIYNMVFKNYRENNTFRKHGILSRYRKLVSFCFKTDFFHLQKRRKWASRKEWGKSSSTLKQCCFSFPNAQSKNYETFFGYFGVQIHFHTNFGTKETLNLLGYVTRKMELLYMNSL